ncbi:MAG: tetratricopeptide repeat protein [Planctomycetota bacterium]|jgi:hypothetical protein
MPEDLPNWREKKEWLWGEDTPPEKQKEMGNAFFRQGRLAEALDFFEQAKDVEGVRNVLGEAVTQGDWFLFKRCRLFFDAPLDEELRDLAGNAKNLGKWLYAFQAYQALDDRPALEEVVAKLKEGFPQSEILVPQWEEAGGQREEDSAESPPETSKGEGEGKKKKS